MTAIYRSLISLSLLLTLLTVVLSAYIRLAVTTTPSSTLAGGDAPKAAGTELVPSMVPRAQATIRREK